MKETTLVHICVGVSLVLTCWHLAEEHRGKLWRYFGAIAGIPVADWIGRLFFTVLLGVTLVLAAFAILGIDGRPAAVWLSLVAIGFLIGGRVSDWWNSHFGKILKGYRWDGVFLGNPGLLSSWFYLADAALLTYLLWVFREVWWADRLLPLGVGLVAGAGLFLAVVPVMTWIGNRFFPRSARWVPDQPIPDWVSR